LTLKRNKRHPLARWSWWKMLALLAFAFGLPGAMLGFFPPVSFPLIRLGLLFSVPGIFATMLYWWNFSWWARLAGAALWTLEIFAIAIRGWILVMGTTWIWVVPISSAYVLAWALPALNPRLSKILWREQWTPQTRLGRALLGLALAIGPSAGVLGASLGLFGGRFGETATVVAVGAALASFAAISIAFALSYQIWPERPWAKKTATRP